MAESYDAIVVGSGATGGWAAKELAESGLRVALIEAGPSLAAAEAPPSGAARQATQSRCYAYDEATAHLFVDDVDNPYSTPEGEPFEWIRSRLVGGRMHLWGRTCLRMSDRELKAAAYDGASADWPLSYADLAPYYDRVERFLRVCGTAEGLPGIPDGPFLAPPPPTRGERRFKAAVERRWGERTVTAARIAQAPPEATLEAAKSTGRLTLLADSVASRVVVDERSGRARGVAFVERLSGREREVEGRVVVLCASAIESARLLLNSATDEHPEGLGNSSGLLGRYLIDHTYGIGLDGIVPQRSPRRGERSSHGLLMPSFRNAGADGAGFIRGYGVELQAHPPAGGRLEQLRGLGRPWGGRFWMRTFGEALPRFENRVALDAAKTDAWGIPVAHIACRYGENEELMAADQLRSLTEMAEAAGWEVEETHPRIAPPGLSVHEMGTARMGADPDGSVLNPHNQTWDVENLFVTDGACFASGGFQNPTLTMMALTVRACDHIVARLKGNEL